jgi:hypothetical protein
MELNPWQLPPMHLQPKRRGQCWITDIGAKVA